MTEQHPPEEEALYELDKLEEDVKIMANKLSQIRDTLPDQLHNTLASIISAQRPPPLHSHNHPNPESGILIEEDPAHAEKLERIKQKISSNTAAMSSQLKRMKDCISRIDKLDSFNNGIHPAFKRNKDCFM